MEYYAGIDVSLECSSVCVVDGTGKIIREAKVVSEPAALMGYFGSLGFAVSRIGLEAGPLSQWLYAAMKEAELAVELLETRHVRDAFKAMPVKSDYAKRNPGEKSARPMAAPSSFVMYGRPPLGKDFLAVWQTDRERSCMRPLDAVADRWP